MEAYADLRGNALHLEELSPGCLQTGELRSEELLLGSGGWPRVGTRGHQEHGVGWSGEKWSTPFGSLLLMLQGSLAFHFLHLSPKFKLGEHRYE